jgi:hypothetical protein
MVGHSVTIWGHVFKLHHGGYHRITGDYSMAYEMMLWIEKKVPEVKNLKNLFFNRFFQFLVTNEWPW